MLRCKYCGEETRNIQGMRAHLKCCRRRPESVLTSIRVGDKADWDRFKEFCRRHGLTTCHFLNLVIKAVPMVEQTGVRFEMKDGKLNISGREGTNPIVFNFTVSETFLGKPRSAWKAPLQESCKLWPPSCEFADDFIRSIREVGCTRSKEWTRLEECWSCFQRGGKNGGFQG